MSLHRLKVAETLEKVQYPDLWPFTPADFRRDDETTDTLFYSTPRLVYHIDDSAVKSLTSYYRSEIAPGSDVLDICSSWLSHFPTDLRLGRVIGLGINELELKENKQLTDYIVKDLNVDPIFPVDDASVDVVTCVVSVDYLTRPLEIFSEIRRVLRPGGRAIISQSNRCFPSKAINIWLNTNDVEHAFIIGCYFHFAGGFRRASAKDISSPIPFTDPMFIVEARKL